MKKRVLILLIFILIISSVYAYSAREFLEDYKNIITIKAVKEPNFSIIIANATQIIMTIEANICFLFIFSFKNILANKNMKIGAKINKIVVNTIP